MAVTVTYSENEAFETGLVSLLRAAGIRAESWVVGTEPPEVNIDLAVAGVTDIQRVRTMQQISPARIVAIVSNEEPETTRAAVLQGAVCVLPLSLPAKDQTRLIGEVLRRVVDVIPAGTLGSLVSCLEDRPDTLEDEERRFIEHLLILSVEAAGRELGYPRRTAQRRFRAICDRFGFANRVDLAVGATRWGLTPPRLSNMTGLPRWCS